MTFRALRRAVIDANGTAVALEDRRLATLLALGAEMARGEKVTNHALFGADGDSDRLRKEAAALAQPQMMRTSGGKSAAVVNFRGTVIYDLEFQPFAVSTKLFARTMKQLAADPAVSHIAIMTDSPGGMVIGTPEAAEAVYQATRSKKVTAIVDGLAASAAYWIVSQATEITALASGEGVGSIGVRMIHLDCSKAMEASGVKPTIIKSGRYKAEGNAFEPLSDEALAWFQAGSDTIYADFVKAVARGRGVSVAKVRSEFGEGRVIAPADAKRRGMLDRVESPEAAVQRLIRPEMAAAVELEEHRRRLEAMAAEASDEPPPQSDAAAELAEMRRRLEQAAAGTTNDLGAIFQKAIARSP